MIQYTGKISIEGADFWQFVQNYLKDTNIIFSSFEIMDHDLILSVAGSTEKEYIPSEVLSNWIIETYMPNPAHECLWDVPFWNKADQALEIAFAAGTDHPTMWANKPTWMYKK